MKNFKIAKIQQQLKDKAIDALIINRTDEFLNEYIPPDAERLSWATDFSGSAGKAIINQNTSCLLYTSPSPRDLSTSRMPSSA